MLLIVEVQRYMYEKLSFLLASLFFVETVNSNIIVIEINACLLGP